MITIDPRQDVLLVIDIQNDFVSGSLAIAGAEDIVAPVNRAASLFDHVVVITDWHPPRHISFASRHGVPQKSVVTTAYGEQFVHADHCVQGSWGAELAPGLELAKAELVLRKGYREDVDSYGAFYENDGTTVTGLSAYLKARGLTRVFCSGLARYACVMHTALGARRDGFEVFILRDASAGGRNPEAGEAAIAAAGIGWTDTTGMARG